MAWKGRELGTDQFDYNKLLPILSEARVKQNDNPLFQVINTLIRGANGFQSVLKDKLGKGDKLPISQVEGILPPKQGGVKTGSYTPAVILIANVSVGVDLLYWSWSVDTVNVFGRFQVLPTAAGANTEFGFELPIISYFSFPFQCAGSGYSPTVNQGAAIIGDVPNNRAKMQFLSTGNVQFDIYFTFGYKIIAK